MRIGKGGKDFLSNSNEGNGDNDDDELPRKKQSMDVWLPRMHCNFCDHIYGGHLDKQMQRAALPANAKAIVEKQANLIWRFHLERMSVSRKVNNLVYWAEPS